MYFKARTQINHLLLFVRTSCWCNTLKFFFLHVSITFCHGLGLICHFRWGHFRSLWHACLPSWISMRPPPRPTIHSDRKWESSLTFLPSPRQTPLPCDVRTGYWEPFWMSQTSAFLRCFQVDILSDALTGRTRCLTCISEACRCQRRREMDRFSPTVRSWFSACTCKGAFIGNKC